MSTRLASATWVATTLAVLCAPSLQAQGLRTFTTDHYRISYMPGTERTARRVAEVAEEVFPHLAAQFQYYDDYAPIHILVRDDSDFGNGSASDWSNHVNIWASNVDWEIRGEHDWIRNVLTHEITHVITIDKARKKWPFRFALFSVSRFDSNPDISFEFPLYYLSTPKWWVEGIAQMGPYAFGWDTWDSHRDMLLRMAVFEDDLHTYNEMGTLNNRTGGYRGEMVYNQGYGLLIYIADQYGRDKVNQLQEHVGVLSFEVAIRRVLGISADQLYDNWARFLDEQYGQQIAEIRSQGFFEGMPHDRLNGGVLDFHPAYSPDGTKLAYISSEDRDYRIPRLAIYDFDRAEQKVLEGTVDTRVSWSPDSKEVFFVRNRAGRNDLYVYNLDKDEEHRLSAALRPRDPHVSPDGKRLTFVRNEDGSTNLCMINRDGTGLQQLTNYQDGSQIYSPKWSPDGEWILFSLFRGEDRDIARIRAESPPLPKQLARGKKSMLSRLVNKKDTLSVFPDSIAFPHADTSGFEVLLASHADERDPAWLADGSGFVFSSDRSGIFNIYRCDLESAQVTQLTNVLGGAFSATVSAAGRVTYASYHSNDFQLYEFSLGEYERELAWDSLLARDYQTVKDVPSLSDEYNVGNYGGRRLIDVVPLLQVGPTFVGNQFGLNQVSGGMFLSTGEALGGDRFAARALVGKNFREDTDLNTDFLLFYERSLRPVESNNNGFNPSFFAALRRREIDFIINGSSATADTFATATIYPVPADSVNLLVPDAEQYRIQADSRKDRFKDVFGLLALGVEVPITRRNEVFVQYVNRDYDEDWALQRLRQQTRFFIVQDSTNISTSLPQDLIRQDTLLVDRSTSFPWYEGLDFFDSHDLTFAWRYQRVKPTEDYLVNATGRSATLIYRYMKTNLADSLAQQTSPDGVPRDFFAPDRKPMSVNEYVASYTERIGLPFYNRVSFEVLGAYRNTRLKPSFVDDGGFFEGRFYWPLRYYLGGLGLLSGYPYFTKSGSKLLYAKVSYGFPVFRRINMSFLNFTFAKMYAELFAETGAVGNFRKLKLDEFEPNDFLSDVGGELRLEMFTNYRIPMRVFFQVAHPLNRTRLQREETREVGLSVNDPDAPRKVDKLRYYFGLGFFPQDLLSVGTRKLSGLGTLE
ncbi:MAG: LpqB family beta-propeller domain-containing protein [Candidatus Latescibacterota bacterium]|nr:LpqB family beta-propeller domain-containing protein [Candidatus Latescibacterota bacterium]